MYRCFVVLFCVIFVVGIQGTSHKTSALTHKDAIEIAQLIERVWSLKPTILTYSRPLVYCQVMDQCCDEEDRSKAISIIDVFEDDIDLDEFANVMKQCVNKTTSNKENQLCTAVIKSIIPAWIAFTSPNVNKYMNIMEKYVKQLDELDKWTTDCNGTEVHAILCLSNTKLVESCAIKMVQKIFNDDYKNYKKTIKDFKQLLSNANQELVMAFTKNTNTN